MKGVKGVKALAIVAVNPALRAGAIVAVLGGVASANTLSGYNNSTPHAHFIASAEGKYVNFSGSDKEFKSLTQVKVKGVYYDPQSGLRIKAGDNYQHWKYQDWLNQVGVKDSISIHVPFLQVGKFFKNGLYAQAGFAYVSADTNDLTADGAFDVNLALEGEVAKGVRLGLFNSYLRIANGRSADGEVFQFSPYAVFGRGKIFGRAFVSVQMGAIHLKSIDETYKKVYARGGLDVGIKVIPNKVDVMVGGEYGKGYYWVNPNGEDIDTQFRPNNGKAYAKVLFKPISGKNLVVSAGIEYQSWKTFKNTGDLEGQSGLGVKLGLTYAF